MRFVTSWLSAFVRLWFLHLLHDAVESLILDNCGKLIQWTLQGLPQGCQDTPRLMFPPAEVKRERDMSFSMSKKNSVVALVLAEG